MFTTVREKNCIKNFWFQLFRWFDILKWSFRCIFRRGDKWHSDSFFSLCVYSLESLAYQTSNNRFNDCYVRQREWEIGVSLSKVGQMFELDDSYLVTTTIFQASQSDKLINKKKHLYTISGFMFTFLRHAYCFVVACFVNRLVGVLVQFNKPTEKHWLSKLWYRQ